MSVQWFLRSTQLAPALLLCVALVACGSAAGTRVGALIDESGGTVAISEGSARGASVEVPRGAVDEPTRFEVSSGPAASGLAAGLRAVGPMITFGPEGVVFATPVHITLPATSEPMVLLTRPHGSGPWARVDGAVWDAATGLVSADVMHFSDFVPVEREEIILGDGGTIADDAGRVDVDAGDDFCVTHPRDRSCVIPDPILPGCDAIAQDCALGQMCVATDQESGYDWGDGRAAYCIPAGSLPESSPCVAPSDCAVGTQCVFQTRYDESTIWYSQETDYLPRYDSFCMTVCTHGGSGCAADERCHPVQLWGFSGDEVNETVGVCAPPPPGSPPRT